MLKVKNTVGERTFVVGSEVREYDSPKSIVSESEKVKVKKWKSEKWKWKSDQFFGL